MEIVIIILGYVPAIIYYLMKGSRAMDTSLNGINIWQLIISIGIPIISIVISVFASTRSANGKVVSAQKDLSKEHIQVEGNLSEQHTKMMGEISKENTEIKADISKTQTKIDYLNQIINSEIMRKDKLSPDLSTLYSAVDMFKIGLDKAVQENIELKKQVNLLSVENADLKADKERLAKELNALRSANYKKTKR